MVLGTKERKEVVSLTLERLSSVIGASGKAEELVRLTTQIVTSTKKLVEGTPEPTKTRSTATLAEFVVAAKRIAQNVRAVDSNSLQQLSATKRAVENLVKELDSWHETQTPDRDLSLDEILSQTSQMSRQDSRSSSGSRGKGSPPITPTSELEKKLLTELKRQHETLLKKTDPQTNPEQHGQPDDVLKMAVTGLSRSIKEMTELSSQKNPSKEALIEPTILLAKMVSVLMDLVDSLFVSKFPMRTQVHSFCVSLVENTITYNAQSKTEDAATLRLISTQAPALMSALEVMVEQCYARSQNIRESQQMSIQRKVDLKELETGISPRASPAVKRRKEPPTPPSKKVAAAPVPQEFEIWCMICTGVAVDSQTNHMMSKGSEISLKVDASKTVLDVRKILSQRTGLPLGHIQLRFQGDNDLPDDTKVTKDNPVPYFMFNLHEPGEDELQEIRKTQRKKNRMRIDDADWTRVTSPVAVAIYDYDALAEPGEDDNLEFDEGDLIEIIEKSADGWWTGQIDGKVGVFPASFVEPIQIPKSKDEAKKLVKKFRQGRLGVENNPETRSDTVSLPDESEEPQSKHPSHQSQTGHQAQPPKFGKFRKTHSSTGLHESASSGFAPSSKRSQSVRKAEHFENDKKDKKGGSKRISHLFKKKHHSYQPISEEKGPSDAHEPSRASLPPLSSRRTPTIDEEASLGGAGVRPEKTAILPPARPLFRPASSPRLNMKSAENSKPATSSLAAAGGGGGGTGPKRRPARPPPPPPPYARKYGQQGLTDLIKKQPSDEGDTEPSSGSGGVSPVPPREDTVSPASITMLVPIASPPTSVSPAPAENDEEEFEMSPVKESKSMEELFKNLEEFDEFSSNTPPLTNGIHKKDKGERDFGTIPRDELPIKVADDDDDDGEGEDDEATDESEAREGGSTPARTPDICVTEPSLESKPTLSVSSEPSKPSSPSAPTVSSQPPAKPPRLRKKQALAKKLSQPSPAAPATSSKPQPPPKPSAESLSKDERERSGSPQPKAPPRRKSKKMSERMAQFEKKEDKKEESKGSVSNAPKLGKLSPTPPAKPKSSKHLSALERSVCSSAPASRTSSPDIKKNSAGGLVRESSSSTDHLESSMNPSRSPVVMRRTCAVVKGNEQPHSDEELEECTGVGKEGMLHKEGTQSVNWKARYFRLLEDRVIYYDNGSHSQDTKPLGEVLASKMQGAMVLGEKNNFYCFAINMRYDTSIVLGCKSSDEAEDWAKSINKMMQMAKSEVRAKTYGPSYKTALKCVSYLSEEEHTTKDKVFTSVTGNSGKINKWLESIDKGEDPDLSGISDAATAVCLLRALFRNGRLGCLVEHELAEELCDLTKSASPLDVLCTKLEQISGDYRGLLKQLLRLFSQVLQHSDTNHTNVEDLNRSFGPLLFEKVAVAQSEPLLAYLISTCELVLS